MHDTKTTAKGKLQLMQLVETGDGICPVRHLKNYLRFEPGLTGPLFRTRKGTPITQYLFVRMLETVLKFLNVSSAAVKPHSFRHDGACYLCNIGASLEFIMSKGRWKSHAVHTHVGKMIRSEKQGVLKRKGKITRFRFNQLFDDAYEAEAVQSLSGAPLVSSKNSLQGKATSKILKRAKKVMAKRKFKRGDNYKTKSCQTIPQSSRSKSAQTDQIRAVPGVKIPSFSKSIQTEELECLVDIHLMCPQLKGKQMVSATATLVNGLVYSEVEVPKFIFNHHVGKGRRPFPGHAHTQTDRN